LASRPQFGLPNRIYNVLSRLRLHEVIAQLRFAQKSRQTRKHLQVTIDVGREQQKEKSHRGMVGRAIFDSYGMSSKNDERFAGDRRDGISGVRNGHTATDCGAG